MFNDNGSFLLALFEFFLFFAWFMCLFWVLGDIFRSKDLGGGAKTFWIFFVIIIPWLGVLVYVIARGKGMQERQLEQAKDMQAAQAEYIKSVAGIRRVAGRPDQLRQGTARQRCDHPGGVRPDQGQGTGLGNPALTGRSPGEPPSLPRRWRRGAFRSSAGAGSFRK